MASYASCLFFFLLALSLSLQIHGRESKFFSKVTKTTKENHDSISMSPASPPSLAPALSPEPQVVEHGYGLYGRDPYEYPSTTENPTKTTLVGEEKYVPNNGNENGYVSEKQGMSDTRFVENGKYYYDVNKNGKEDISRHEEHKGNEKEVENRNENGKQGMSDTRFVENGKYFYDVNKDGMDVSEGDEVEHKMVHEYVPEKQGMSDTRYLKNGKYFYDTQKEEGFKGENNENEQFQEEKHGMSDTRFLDNGKYFNDVKDENENPDNYGNGNGNQRGYYGGNNEYVTEKRGYHYNGNTKSPNEYVTQGKKGNYGSAKKFPNEYDTMEEYDREQGYIDPQDGYIP